MSLVARHLEALGLPTLCFASALDIIQAGAPPRAVFIDYPLGHASGKTNDPADQYEIAQAAIAAWPRFRGPGEIIDLERSWAQDETWKQASEPAGGEDQRAPRDTTPRYQNEADRELAEAAGATA